MPATGEAIVRSVRPGSIAARNGLKAGDRLLSVNGAPLRDQIDYGFYTVDDHLAVVVARGDKVFSFTANTNPGEDFGLEFAEATFDGVRRCRNRCPFCFVERLPKGLRRSLYVKDDDYRYSFLFGSYVTLTNLREEDWDRIAAQRLSPLYVSVHATDLDLRRRMLGNPTAPDILTQLRRLRDARVDVHAQIVLCPGWNDGPALERRVMDLAALHDCVRSTAIVPVGLTRFGPDNGIRTFTAPEMEGIVERVSLWQREFRRSLGRTFVHLSDEFYLRTGLPLPGPRSYDGYPQYENGVGMARVLLSEWTQVSRRLQRGSVSLSSLAVVCGELAERCLRPIVEEISSATGVTIRLYAVRNRFFGPTVTTSGLLTAGDVVSQLKDQPLGDLLVLPRTMFDSDGIRTLDEGTADAIRDSLGTPVVTALSIKELARWAAGSAQAAAG